MDSRIAGEAEGPRPPHPFALGFVPLWIAAVLMTWWATDRQLLPPAIAAHGQWSAAGLVTGLTRLVLFTLEALVYWAAWRALGTRLNLFTLAMWILSLSMFDALAVRIGELGRAHPSDWTFVAIVLAGPVAVAAPGAATTGTTAAVFGTVGLLDVVRIGAWCDVQRRAARTTWRRPVVITLALWTVSRLALWWGLDLVRGRSLLH
jgi:hypothetical protein